MVFLAFAEGAIQLLPDGTILIHIALILAMIYILNRTFFRPINKVIESREKTTGGGLSEAQSILRQVDEKKALLESELLDARNQGYQLIEKERGAAVAKRNKAIETVKAEVESKISNDHKELNAKTDAARAEISKQAEIMAEKISSNILKVV